MICLGENPLTVIKSGEEINFVFPNGTNQNFQYQKWNCEDEAEIAGLSSDGVLISFFLSLILLGAMTSFLTKRYL